MKNQETLDYHLEHYLNANFPDIISIRNSNNSFAYIPIEKTIYNYLQNFDSLDCFLFDGQRKSILESFFDSESCNSINTLYINVFVDDFQLSNPLLSKKALLQEFTGIYFRILTKSHLRFSKKNNIFLLAICKKKFFCDFSNDIIFFLANEIKNLNEKKISIFLSQRYYSLGLTVPFFSLDSKSANFLFWFKNSFNHPYCCRFCLTRRSDFSATFCDSDVVLRTHAQYNINYGNLYSISDGDDLYGIISKSPLLHFDLNDLAISAPPCIAHDVYEGIGIKLLKLCISYCLSKKVFNVSHFFAFYENLKLTGRDKVEFPLINFKNIDHLRLTFHECYTFFRFFLLFLSNYLSLDADIFVLLKIFTQISNFLMQCRVKQDSLAYLSTKIMSFLRLFSHVFPNASVTIKFHHLIHYPWIISKLGPLRFLSTVNFESMHSNLKNTVLSSKNRISSHLTIAKRYARASCIYEKPFFDSDRTVESEIPEILLNNIENIRSCSQITKLYMYHSVYKQGSFISGYDEEEFRYFFEIDKIFFVNNNYYFVGFKYDFFYDGDRNIIFIGDRTEEYYIDVLSGTYEYPIYLTYTYNTNKIVFPYCSTENF